MDQSVNAFENYFEEKMVWVKFVEYYFKCIKKYEACFNII